MTIGQDRKRYILNRLLKEISDRFPNHKDWAGAAPHSVHKDLSEEKISFLKELLNVGTEKTIEQHSNIDIPETSIKRVCPDSWVGAQSQDKTPCEGRYDTYKYIDHIVTHFFSNQDLFRILVKSNDSVLKRQILDLKKVQRSIEACLGSKQKLKTEDGEKLLSQLEPHIAMLSQDVRSKPEERFNKKEQKTLFEAALIGHTVHTAVTNITVQNMSAGTDSDLESPDISVPSASTVLSSSSQPNRKRSRIVAETEEELNTETSSPVTMQEASLLRPIARRPASNASVFQPVLRVCDPSEDEGLDAGERRELRGKQRESENDESAQLAPLQKKLQDAQAQIAMLQKQNYELILTNTRLAENVSNLAMQLSKSSQRKAPSVSPSAVIILDDDEVKQERQSPGF